MTEIKKMHSMLDQPVVHFPFFFLVQPHIAMGSCFRAFNLCRTHIFTYWLTVFHTAG